MLWVRGWTPAVKVPIRPVEILHICDLWVRLRKIVTYLVGRKLHLHGFFAVKVNGSYVNIGICVIVKTRSYRHTENISLKSEPNRYYLMKIKVDGIGPILGHFAIKKPFPQK